ncbi:MAG TPA: Flp1 family type IVb pilin [Clostridia bacterium]
MKKVCVHSLCIRRKSGIGTVEVVILIAVLVGIALIFREQLTDYARRIMEVVFNDDIVIDSLT